MPHSASPSSPWLPPSSQRVELALALVRGAVVERAARGDFGGRVATGTIGPELKMLVESVNLIGSLFLGLLSVAAVFLMLATAFIGGGVA
ncbi:MAG: hypothetical protein B7Z38_00730 [Rhodobacterales bacterium 12-64-8]|nr:MAG: hypothetical protein B7Z38_00730 [Rhodobacterales bacterium 12-64-8]